VFGKKNAEAIRLGKVGECAKHLSKMLNPLFTMIRLPTNDDLCKIPRTRDGLELARLTSRLLLSQINDVRYKKKGKGRLISPGVLVAARKHRDCSALSKKYKDLSVRVKKFHEGLSEGSPDNYSVDLRTCAADLMGEIDAVRKRGCLAEFYESSEDDTLTSDNEEDSGRGSCSIWTWGICCGTGLILVGLTKLVHLFYGPTKLPAQNVQFSPAWFMSFFKSGDGRRRLLGTVTSIKSLFRQTRAYDR